MSQQICRWGILGTAAIARKNWRGIRLAGNAQVTAVASRSDASAQRFIDECSFDIPQPGEPTAVGGYQELLKRDDVDAVYIPLPTGMRHEWVIRAAEAGKHVLAEKPAALNASQVEEMVAACRENNVQYMDGVMFMHSDRLPLVNQLVNDADQVGELRRLAAQFSFAGDDEFCTHNIRVNSELEPHGCLGDLGWYCIRYFLCAMNGQLPTEVRGRCLRNLQGQDSPGTVPGEFSADLTFPNGISAHFYCSFVTQHQQWFHASGNRGWVRVNDFVLPFHSAELEVTVGQDVFRVDNTHFHMERHHRVHAVDEYDAAAPTAQEVKMLRTFSSLAIAGTPDPQWPEWTVKTQRVLDACFASAQQDGATVSL